MSRMCISIKEKRGVTLVEVLVAAAILSLVAVSVLFIFVQTVDMSGRVDYEYKATNIAKSRLERARRIIDTRGFDFLSELAESNKALNDDGVPDVNGNFIRTTTVTHPYNANERLTRVSVDVYYTFRGRTSAPAIMTAIFADIDY